MKRWAPSEIESAPLWTAVGSPHPSTAVLPEVDQVWRVAAAEIREYLRKERARTLAQVALLVALAAGIVAIRRRSRDWLNTSNPFAARAAVVLSRPVSSAALIMILLGLASAAPPTAVRQLLGVLVLVPFFRLLPVIARRRLLPPLHVLGALWVVARFQYLVLPHSLLERLLMLATGITGLVGDAFALRPKSPVRALASTPMRRVLIMGSCVAGAALAVAIVSNVFGK